MGGKSSRLSKPPKTITPFAGSLESFVEKLPNDLKTYLLTNFFDVRQLVLLRSLSSAWYHYIDDTHVMWKHHLETYFPSQYAEITNHVDFPWRKEFIKTWKEVMYNCWDNTFAKREISYKENNRKAIHGKGIYYLPIKTKVGYKSGVHYWEVTPSNCTYDGYNVYIGVTNGRLDTSYYLGHDENGWGLKGSGGGLHNGGVVATAKRSFKNNHVVGLLLDMDKYNLKIYINGEQVLSYDNPKWEGQMLYPSCSLIQDPDSATINFNVKRPFI